MSQYSLSYDSSGNSSLTATSTTPTRITIPSGDWKVSDYVSRTQGYGVTETFKDKNTPQEQLKAITKILVPSGNDSKDDKEVVKKDYSPEFNWKDYTYTEMSKALGIDAADAWAKAYDIEKGASALSTGLGLAGIFMPIDWMIKGAAKGIAYSADKYKQGAVKNYINSDYFSDQHESFELEYELTGDYADSHNDINWGPSYGNEYKEGTVFDAEDEENYSTPVEAPTPVSTPFHPSQGNNNNDNNRDPNQGNTQTGHGKSGMGRDPDRFK